MVRRLLYTAAAIVVGTAVLIALLLGSRYKCVPGGVWLSGGNPREVCGSDLPEGDSYFDFDTLDGGTGQDPIIDRRIPLRVGIVGGGLVFALLLVALVGLSGTGAAVGARLEGEVSTAASPRSAPGG